VHKIISSKRSDSVNEFQGNHDCMNHYLKVINTNITSQLRRASPAWKKETILNRLNMCVQTMVEQRCPDDNINDSALT